MKKPITLSFIAMLLTSISSLAQWNIDAANPQIVCNESCNQSNVTSISDGNGGVFVFWRDSRSGCNGNNYFDIYGQHYSSAGDKLWEDTGRLIYDLPSSVTTYAVNKTANPGEFIIGAHTGFNSALDSLRFQKFNVEGDEQWSSDLLVAYAQGCEGNYFLGIENFSFIPISDGFKVNLVPTYCGGADGCRITAFNEDGQLTGPLHGSPEGVQWYIGARGIANTYDGSDDIYIYHTDGNGQGAHARVMRIGAAGDSIFAPIDVLEGTDGLNYQYSALSDPSGIAVCFASNGGSPYPNLYMRKLNGNGTWAWNGDIIPVCEADGEQSTFSWIQDEDYYYIAWSDGRPGVVGYYAIYAQKIDKSNGQAVWEEDGKLLADVNTYIPGPRITFDNDGNLMLTFQASAEPYYNAQLFDTNGDPLWSNAVSVAAYALGPFYSDYAVTNSNGNMVVAWAMVAGGGGADGIYIARLAQPSVTIEETISACDSYTVNGETFTQSGTYTQLLPGDTTYVLNLTINTANIDLILDGNTLEAQTTEGLIFWIDCSDNSIVLDDSQTFTPTETGNYALMVQNNNCSDTSSCYLIEIIDVRELQEMNYTLYPNPGHDFLTLNTSYSFQNATLEWLDASGRVVKTYSHINGPTHTLNTSDLISGFYIIRIANGEEHNNMHWIKH